MENELYYEEVSKEDVPPLDGKGRNSVYATLYLSLQELGEGKFIRVPAVRSRASIIQANVKQLEARNQFPYRFRTQWHRPTEALYIWKEIKTGN